MIVFIKVILYILWVGLIQDWKPHGKGYLTMKDGTEFDGEFVNGEYLNI